VHEVSAPDYWRGRYRAGDAPWDLGGPCPVFVELLASPRAPPRGRTAFPGCGKGHDVRLFLEHGYDAVGFDFAVEPEGVPFERLDVFRLGARHPGRFDVIVEYTCYCAIDPARRAEYAASLRAALRPGGVLVALLFPVEAREGGPPFSVTEDEIRTVLGRGLRLDRLETPKSSVPARLGRERLAIYTRTST
jgi:SAM-dependent methyltransferase